MRFNDHLQKALHSKRFSYALVILWMGLIFLMSHQEAGTSAKLSSGFTFYVEKFLILLSGKEDFDFSFLHFLSRKGAHFSAYFILGILILRALPSPTPGGGLISLSLAMVYAASDEFHQTFVLGRSGEVKDILLDTTGAFTGILLYLLVKKVWPSLKKSA